MKRLNVVILAAGKGERMVSKRPKVMHEIMGQPMIRYVVERARELSPARIIVVVGYGRDKVEEYLRPYPVTCALQRTQKGTAHALLAAGKFLDNGDVLVLYGDVPMIKKETLKDFLSFYKKTKSITFMTTDVTDPGGYGRVIMSGDEILEIKEDVDATRKEREIKRINTGICIIPAESFHLLKAISADNKKGEHYLTDICKIGRQRGESIKGYNHESAREVLGINTRRELLEANTIMRQSIIGQHMQKGVTILDGNVYIESGVKIGIDTTIFPNCYLLGRTVIGRDVVIGPNVIVKDSVIRDNVAIEGFVTIDGAEIKEDAKIGPFSRLRPGTVIGKGARIGNFVEVKNSRIDKDSRAGHLAYIGDTEVGKNVNIGAGTITCNYDGVRKHRTVIGDNVFVGSNTELIAPVKIGKDAVVGAGSTITKDVPGGALALTRVPQKHVPGYGRKKQCAE